MSMAVLFFASLSGFTSGLAVWTYSERIQSHWPWTIIAVTLWVIAAGFAVAGFTP